MLSFSCRIFEQGLQIICSHTILQVLKMPIVTVIITLIAFHFVGPWSLVHKAFLTQQFITLFFSFLRKMLISNVSNNAMSNGIVSRNRKCDKE